MQISCSYSVLYEYVDWFLVEYESKKASRILKSAVLESMTF